MKFTCIFLFGFLGLANAEITAVGNSTSYTVIGGDWLSNIAYDIDANGLGTDGFIFFGDHAENGGKNSFSFDKHVKSLPIYVSEVNAGNDFYFVAEGHSHYGRIDNPLILDGSDSIGGFAAARSTGAGQSKEVVTFSVDGVAEGVTIRLGILAGIEGSNDGRWDPTSITLGDGTDSVSVGIHNASPLPSLEPSNTGWVFFDIDTDGQYSISVTTKTGKGGAGIGGITFDSLVPRAPATFVPPHIGEVELQDLQSVDGTDGDLIQTAVRQFRVETGAYLNNAFIPIGAYAEGTVHKLVVNSTVGDSASLVEFAVKEGGELDLIQYHQTGSNPYTLLNVGLGSLEDSLELGLMVPTQSHGDITVTHYTSSLNTWADTQYNEQHFTELSADAVINPLENNNGGGGSSSDLVITNSIQVGGGTTTGSNSVAIGQNAVAGSDNSLAIGANAETTEGVTLAVDGDTQVSGNVNAATGSFQSLSADNLLLNGSIVAVGGIDADSASLNTLSVGQIDVQTDATISGELSAGTTSVTQLSVGSELDVTGNAEISGDTTIGGALNAQNVGVTDLSVSGTTSFAGDITGQNASFNDVAINGTSTFNGSVIMTAPQGDLSMGIYGVIDEAEEPVIGGE